ncbi:MAG: phage tail spike protein [Anaerostipes sp.]|uniref:phage tail spike protein n=1 Tax=Anaerostipes sp. TaxID=1872530 RepID=UPI003996AA0A
MIIYFADRKMNILGQASTNLPKGVVIKEDTKTEEIETGVCTFECRICYSKETRQSIEEWSEAGNYILRSSDSDQEFYTIISVEIDTENQDIYIYAEDAGMDLLNEVLKSSKDGVARNLTEYINSAAYDSGFEIGINESDDSVKIAYGLDEQTAGERVLDISKKFGYEIAYSFAIDRLEVVHKYINIYKKRGKDTGVQLRLNREVEKITIKKSVENLATSLLCTGSADASGVNISLEGYSYDDGDFYTSGHYLNSRNALAKWSRYLWHKEPGQINNVGHIVRTFTYDTVSQEELCKKSVEELKKICDIEKNYEVQITHLPDNVKIGDILNIVDDAGNLYLQSRLLKLETSIVSDTRTATLGDYLIRDDGISEKVEQLATQFKDLAKNKALYTWIVYADDSFGNGITIDPDGKDWVGITENQVSKDADLSDPLIYKWSRIGGYQGEQGEPGADGISVVSIDDQYYLSTSSESVVGGSWQDGIPEWERGKYVWKRYKVTWSDNNVTYTNAELDRALNHANEAADLAEQKATEAEKAANTASEAATNASKSAETASTASAAAQSLANDANKNAADAKEAANTAQTAADEANKEVETINKEISTIKEDAASTSKELQGKITSITETMEASYAKKTDVSETEASLRAEWTKSAAEIRSTMENDYAKKTELTEVQSNLQTQVTQNATDIISTASAVETVKIDASNAQKKAEEAGAAATAAQSVADRATQAAQTAQNVADRATQAAQTAADEAGKAQTAADSASKAASDADAVAKAAQKDLDTAKANLTAVTNRVDATEEDIAAAQTAVSNAQAAADAAKANAATAQNAANAAQSTADIAKANATTAQNAANAAQTSATNAKTAADNAQKTADEAKTQVGNLSNTVTQMDTKIAQNAAAISLAATKKEVEDKLSGYSTTTEMNSAISVSATGILNTVSGTYTTKSEFNNLSIGGRNIASQTNKGADGWSWSFGGGGGCTKETVVENNIQCAKLIRNDVAVTSWDYIYYSKILLTKFAPSTEYTISFEVRSSVQSWFDITIQNGNATGGVFKSRKIINNKCTANEWSKIVITSTTYDELPELTDQVLYILNMNTDPGTWYIFRNLKIEKGNKATDWTPAPEDIDEEFKKYSTTEVMNSSIEQAANSIKLDVAATYTTKSEFNSMQIGGRNYVIGSSTADVTDWKMSGWTRNTFTTYSASERTYKLVAEHGWVNAYYVVDSSLASNIVTLSFYAKCLSEETTATDNYGLCLSNSSATDPFITNDLTGYKPTQDEWMRLQITFTLNKGHQFGIAARCTPEGVNLKTTWLIKDVKLEKGNKPTDWTPAPEDTEEEIKTINASLELKIDTDKLVSVLNASADIIHLKGNRFIVESDNFNLTADGTMTAKNGTFTGNITATSGKIGDLSLSNGMLIGTGTYTDEYGEETRNYVTQFSSMGINIESSIVSSGAEKYISKITPDEISFEATPYTAGLGALGVYAEGVDGEARISGDHSQFNYGGNEGQLYTTINSGGFVIDYAGLTYGGGTTITIGDGWGITMSGRDGGDHYLRYNAYGTLETSLYTVINASLKSTVNITADGVFYEGGTALSNKYAAKSHTHNAIWSGSYGVKFTSSNNFKPCDNGSDDNYDNKVACGTTSSRWTRLYAGNASISTSDMRLKENIRSFDERYEKLFDSLEPVTYLWRNDGSDTRDDHDRIHTGFIAQQVKKSMDQAGLTVNDFAAFCYDDFTKDPEWSPESTNGFTDRYSLAYEEFISLNTHMIQKTRAEMLIQAGQLGLHQTMLNDLKDQLFEAWKEIKKLKQALAV